MQSRWRQALLLAASVATASPALGLDETPEARTARHFEHIRTQPVALEIFLRQMPKGADLHNHLDGGIYAETFAKWAAADGFCVDRTTLGFVPPPCKREAPPAADFLRDAISYRAVIDAQSMKDFVPSAAPGQASAHDHLFDTFSKFGGVAFRHWGGMVAEATNRAAAEHVAYLELMASPAMADARDLAASIPPEPDFERLMARLEPGIKPIIGKMRQIFDRMEADRRQIQGCGTAREVPGCGVDVRYLAQVIRTFTPEQVFAQSLLAFEAASDDPRIVGVNLVAPEDDPVTLRDYDVQMRQLQFLGQKFPAVRLTLHAGELAPGLVPPEDLRFHIAEAVEIAGARRIGHGVDIAYEDHASELLQEMARKHVLVEINLSSNDMILGVKGSGHPFLVYRQAGVPLALSTDDEGVARIDLTHEFRRATLDYGLSYADLKTLVRNSVEYSFLPGESFWQHNDYQRPSDSCAVVASASCETLLARSDKARIEARLEEDFRRFEQTAWSD